MAAGESPLVDLPDLRDRIGVFRDRAHAGEALAGMLDDFRGGDALILAVPAGGVPVGVAIARTLSLPIDVAVVSKATFPWTTEAGFGAVAFDGTTRINERLVFAYGLSEAVVEEGIAKTKEKIARRVRRFRGDAPFPDLSGRTAILVDDGLASGFTLRAGIAAVRNAGVARLILAVPTGHAESVREIRGEVDALYCANLRGGVRFAVADAYELWYDVTEEEALETLRSLARPPRRSGTPS